MDNPEAGARRLIELMEQPQRLQQMASAAQRRHQESYAPDVAGAGLLNFLSSAKDHRGLRS